MTPEDTHLRIALVEAFYGGSHRAWADGYGARSRHDVELFTLPANNWQWRMTGGSITLANAFMASVDESGPFDVILASDMIDLATFAGVARHQVGNAAIVLYMHENQLTYPVAVGGPDNSGFARINWLSMQAANEVWFNSQFHLDDWFHALPELLEKAPDGDHDMLVQPTRDRSSVMAVGVNLARVNGPQEPRSRATVIWNQRWEHDKDPDTLATAMVRLVAQGVDIDVIVCGEPAGPVPKALENLGSRIGDRLVHFGYAPDFESYARLLRSADIVVSTARQEYFGISLTEAVYAGAFPVLPNRLVYPERLPADVHEHCLYKDLSGLIDAVRWAVDNPQERRAIATSLRPVMEQYAWANLAPKYDAAMERLVANLNQR